MTFKGVDAEIKRLFQGVKDLEKEAIAEVQRAAVVVTQEMMALTPVWQGTTVRNFAASVGGSVSGNEKSPIGGVAPGPTNSMGLGEEPRRPANEAEALADVQGAVAGMRNLQDVFVGNTANDFNAVDSGALPTPQKARNPGGVIRPAQANARAKLGSKWK